LHHALHDTVHYSTINRLNFVWSG